MMGGGWGGGFTEVIKKIMQHINFYKRPFLKFKKIYRMGCT